MKNKGDQAKERFQIDTNESSSTLKDKETKWLCKKWKYDWKIAQLEETLKSKSK